MRKVVEGSNLLIDRDYAEKFIRSTYLELHAAQLAARELYSHEVDRAKFVARVRNHLADEIARQIEASQPPLPGTSSAEPSTPKTSTTLNATR